MSKPIRPRIVSNRHPNGYRVERSRDGVCFEFSWGGRRLISPALQGWGLRLFFANPDLSTCEVIGDDLPSQVLLTHHVEG